MDILSLAGVILIVVSVLIICLLIVILMPTMFTVIIEISLLLCGIGYLIYSGVMKYIQDNPTLTTLQHCGVYLIAFVIFVLLVAIGRALIIASLDFIHWLKDKIKNEDEYEYKGY